MGDLIVAFEIWFETFKVAVQNNIINWLPLYAQGLRNTLLMALGGTAIGVVLGTVVAVIKVYRVYNAKSLVLSILDKIADVYIAIIRGTPVMVQLFILYYILFAKVPMEYNLLVGILAFGINSGGYVAEIIRAGILSVDRGQLEAGRSLGLSQNTTMRLIILPQAIKNILPALFNEFIVLVKETSVASNIAVAELTYASIIVRSRTFDATLSLLFIALIYLVVVLGLTALQKMLERRMSAGDLR